MVLVDTELDRRVCGLEQEEMMVLMNLGLQIAEEVVVTVQISTPILVESSCGMNANICPGKRCCGGNLN